MFYVKLHFNDCDVISLLFVAKTCYVSNRVAFKIKTLLKEGKGKFLPRTGHEDPVGE